MTSSQVGRSAENLALGLVREWPEEQQVIKMLLVALVKGMGLIDRQVQHVVKFIKKKKTFLRSHYFVLQSALTLQKKCYNYM